MVRPPLTFGPSAPHHEVGDGRRRARGVRQRLKPLALLALGAAAAAADAAAETVANDLLERAANASLLWNTRPNVYFGTAPRLPSSLKTGLMWFSLESYNGWQNPRHSCEEGDHIEKYGYIRNDGRTFGEQEIVDSVNNVVLKTEFIKSPAVKHGTDWAVRVSGMAAGKDPAIIGIQYYVALEAAGKLKLKPQTDPDGPLVLSGSMLELGNFTVSMIDGRDIHPPAMHGATNGLVDYNRTQYAGVAIPPSEAWRASDIMRLTVSSHANDLLSKMAQSKERPPPPALIGLPNTVDKDANFFLFQKTLTTPFDFQVLFNSEATQRNLQPGAVENELREAYRKFDERFEDKFHLSEKGYSPAEIDFAKSCLSNLLGGIGFFHGTSIVDPTPYDERDEFERIADGEVEPAPVRKAVNPQLTSPMSLFTATPSRSFYPRGFYWDEGFHHQLIGKWDNDLSLNIIRSWLSLTDKDGWIAREQILGDEARSKVPSEFQPQFPQYANPPTIVAAIKAYLDRLQKYNLEHGDTAPSRDILEVGVVGDESAVTTQYLANPALANSYLKDIYGNLRRHFEWFLRTQRGELKEFNRQAENDLAFRWRGRTENHTLTSGLDDYPRASVPSIGELHLDLLAWVGYASDALSMISEIIDEREDAEKYRNVHRDAVANLDAIHWDEEKKMYCDLSVDIYDDSISVCHKGYVTLFPLLLGLLPHDSPKVEALLKLMHHPDHLWSPYGLRSLSKSDAYYGHGENFWRGPIWVNMNFLALSVLHEKYAKVEGPYRELANKVYQDLRKNIIKTVYESYKKTGYVWEQYSDVTGEGKRSHPFTGWSSLITLIMAEEY